MWPDNETDRDFLNFSGVADTVAEVIVQADGRPISIGVSGSWGVGKSSLIKLIRKSLEKQGSVTRTPAENSEQPRFLFVEFNAWLYQGYDDARAALVEIVTTALQEQAERAAASEDLKERIRGKISDLFRRVDWLRVAKLTAGSAAALAFGLPPVGLVGEVFNLGRRVAAGQVDSELIADAEKTAVDIAGSADGLIKARPDSSPPKEIQAIRNDFEEKRRCELGLFDELAAETQYIGEVGLDGAPENRSSWRSQIEVFEHILATCSRLGGRIMSIHSRCASPAVIDLLLRYPDAGVAVLHWFSGSSRDLKQAIELGCWFSVGPPMLRSVRGRALIAMMPRERVLTETDGPFTQEEGRPLVPADATRAVRGLSSVWGTEPGKVEAILVDNLVRLTGAPRL